MPTATLDLERVTPNIYTTTKLRGCNPSFVTTSDGVVVIDTPQLPTRAVAMRAEAESHGPIRYLINTEHHVDHIFGNYWFKGAGRSSTTRACTTTSWTSTPDLDPFAYALEAIPTDDPEAAPLIPDRDDLLRGPEQGHDRVHRRPDAAGRRPHVPPAPHARAHAGPARRPRARGARRLHRRHDLLRVPDLADDLERRPVARGARADPPARRRPPDPGPRPGPDPRRTSTPSGPCCSSGRRPSPTRWRRAGRARRPIARVRFDDALPGRHRAGLHDGSHPDHNAGSLWDKLTAARVRQGSLNPRARRARRRPRPPGCGRRAGSGPRGARTRSRGSCRRAVTRRSARRRRAPLERPAEPDAVVGQPRAAGLERAEPGDRVGVEAARRSRTARS